MHILRLRDTFQFRASIEITEALCGGSSINDVTRFYGKNLPPPLSSHFPGPPSNMTSQTSTLPWQPVV